jgi:uncharacterized protein
VAHGPPRIRSSARGRFPQDLLYYLVMTEHTSRLSSEAMQGDQTHSGTSSISTADGPVTAVIRRTVKPGKEAEFELWLKGVGGDALQFPGHLGTNIIRPTSRSRPEYIIIFRFDTYKHLEDWETSEIRHRWVQRVQDLIIGETHIHRLSGLEYWFSMQDLPEYDTPPRIKMAVVTWLALFPVVLVVQPVFIWLLDFLPSWTQVMIIAAVMVALMTYVVMPVMTRIFKPWLFRKPRHS